MSRIDSVKVASYLGGFPGDVVCGVQVWYEGLLGHGVMTPEEQAELEALLDSTPGWASAGDVRYEKYGGQKSWKKTGGK